MHGVFILATITIETSVSSNKPSTIELESSMHLRMQWKPVSSTVNVSLTVTACPLYALGTLLSFYTNTTYHTLRHNLTLWIPLPTRVGWSFLSVFYGNGRKSWCLLRARTHWHVLDCDDTHKGKQLHRFHLLIQRTTISVFACDQFEPESYGLFTLSYHVPFFLLFQLLVILVYLGEIIQKYCKQ